MHKPNGLGTQVSKKPYVKIRLGGHKLLIKNIIEGKSKQGKDMLTIQFDTTPDDEQPFYFSQEYKNAPEDKKKWSRVGTDYIVQTNAEGNVTWKFDSFIDSFQKSNPNIQIPWERSSGEIINTFLGKAIGGVFGEYESEYNGKIYTNIELKGYCPINEVRNQPVPEKRVIKSTGYNNVANTYGMYPQPSPNDGFMNVPGKIDEELPFK